jgi:hypothetical protein
MASSESTPLLVLAEGECVASRTAVLRLGALLGWSPSEVSAFAEALTGCPWSHAGRRELQLLHDEYLILLRVLQAKRARRAPRAEADGHALGT